MGQRAENWILVVDDDASNLKIASRILVSSGFRASCVKSGEAALGFVESNRPDLILLDIHMPGMNGFQTIEKLKEKEGVREIPVIFLTADENEESEVQGLKCGALDFIKKPFVPEILVQRVSRTIELDVLQRELARQVEKQTRVAVERQQKIERLSMQIVRTMSSAIDAKDRYTNGHSMRVAEYSRQIAKRCGKTEEEQQNIYMLGLLHDVGKIGIRDAIITKTSRLTDEEYEVIKSHTSIGAEILQNITELPDIAVGAHWHHERYDGRGYPDALSGEEIPEVARIIAVADSYDAMTSKRSYRDALPKEVVRSEIEKGAGNQFDPAFAAIMLQMMDEDTEYRMREGGEG